MTVSIGARRAGLDDAATITAIITAAFAADPLWSAALAGPDGSTDHYERFWRINVAGALRYPWVWMTDGGEATALWIPPGGTELSDEQEDEYVALGHELLGSAAADLEVLLERFEAAHPHEPHYYLPLLATHPDHRGNGLGMELLSHTLELVDAEGMPAYLESSNPVNVPRYRKVGFEPVGEFTGPGGAVVTTMWRAAR